MMLSGLRMVCVVSVSWGFLYLVAGVESQRLWVTTDELENLISPEDLRELLKMSNDSVQIVPAAIGSSTTHDNTSIEDTSDLSVPLIVDCFGLGSFTRQLPWLFNMRPDTSEQINTHFFFSSRLQTVRVQVDIGSQFGLEWVDFKPKRKTVMIVHGFMSHSNASWVNDMAKAYLKWGDVNVVAVDWSGGGNTWRYWRAVANTRRVGADVTRFIRQLMEATGVQLKSFHLVGHSLGAHICSFASHQLGGVARITGLDPAQPCFRTNDAAERLDKSDAEFVDVIHTNGRLLQKIGFGLPEPIGHADFYPNGGMQQPGCINSSSSLWSRIFPVSPAKLQQAVCNHGRAYLLFTESLLIATSTASTSLADCSLRAHVWNLTYEGVNASLQGACDRYGSCAEMGIRAEGGEGLPKAAGAYFVLTAEKEPYCPSESERRHPKPELLRDLRQGFRLDRLHQTLSGLNRSESVNYSSTTKPRSWIWRWIG